jgi:hypothetical protein
MVRTRIPLWIAGLAVLLTIAGCHANGRPQGPGSVDAPEILGAWNWVESTGGIAGITKTPQSSGETWKIEFREDGTYREVRNGQETTGSYVIEKRTSIFDHEMRPAIVIQGRPDVIPARSGGDHLTLSDNVYDGFNNTFVRAR